MKAHLKTPMALGFILALPLFGRPVLGAPAHDAGHRPAHHRIADSAKASALVSPGSYVPAPRKPETDGLSRNPDDCAKYGCIDNSGGQSAPAAPVLRPHETDGLSRNDDECDVGCIDN